MRVSRAFWTLGLSKLIPEVELGGLGPPGVTGMRTDGAPYPWDPAEGGPGMGGRDGFWRGDGPREPYNWDCEEVEEGGPPEAADTPVPLLNRLRILACSSCWWLGLVEALGPADRPRWLDCDGV